ncbi:hypothetical protein [uncultured Sphingomonas sp.]|uniref:hypothetical protein n=1 Tax=uncultured Sphingomonas sp. TaxID=158754 RepID=UPI0035CA707C
MPAASLTLDDGEVERRVRLVRPTERKNLALSALTASCWEEVDQARFVEAWTAETAALPEFIESRFWIITGLLLPIWRRLPEDGCSVYRLQTDEGERVIGRRVAPHWIAEALGSEAPKVVPSDAWAMVLERGSTLQLEGGLSVRRSRVMNAERVELTGFTDGMVERLKAFGLMSEIISWRLRLFIPIGSSRIAILSALLDRFPLRGVVERASA